MQRSQRARALKVFGMEPEAPLRCCSEPKYYLAVACGALKTSATVPGALPFFGGGEGGSGPWSPAFLGMKLDQEP